MSELETACSPIVWCVGGTDSSGGAGVTRDLATLADLGVHGCAIVTLVSAQSHYTMLSSTAMPLSLINEQWQLIANDGPPECIKIGAIANDEQAHLLHALIETLDTPRPFIVWDPVLFSSSKGKLGELSEKAIKQLLCSVDLVTPNISELTSLTAVAGGGAVVQGVNGEKDVLNAARTLMHLGAKSVLVKGGHAHWQHDATDVFFTQNEAVAFSQPRAKHSELRGTGCMQASAIAACVAKAYCINDALTLANAYVKNVRDISAPSIPSAQNSLTPSQQHALNAPYMPKLAGFPEQPSVFPTVNFIKGDTLHGSSFSARTGLSSNAFTSAYSSAHASAYSSTHVSADATAYKIDSEDEATVNPHKSHTEPFLPLLNCNHDIYPVVDSADWIEALLPTGVTIIQLRIKEGACNHERTCEQIQRAVALTKGTSCQLFINDHWQLAIEHGAYGVHLGQEDLFTADIEAIKKAGLRLGVSTHGYAEIQRVKKLAPSYIALGHIFATTTKDMPSMPQGIKRLKQYVDLCGNIPTVAIGGINSARCKAIADTGVTHVAVVRAITEAPCPHAAYHTLQKEAGFVN
ncbi:MULTISPECIES: thiamine phosphate synthase [unclassified Alteromonas]|uniref:thiamine phosphate synthase n=1 Tax=unclassified Alteromonas TaxID=2614992 RepID=UPI0005099F05|nr:MULTISPECIES: thiamine phosphate synthase [unclassified Alteromonas]